MRKLHLLIGCFVMWMQAGSQGLNLDYAAGTIADSLKKDAVAVYRLDEAVLDVRSPSSYTFTVHQVVTILNDQGAYYLHHKLGFDKFYKVEAVDIKMYNALGLLTKTYGRKDFDVEAAYDGILLVTDNKLMKLYTPAPGYPCTIDVQYKLSTSGYLELPNWSINTSQVATEVFRYVVNVPTEIDIRHRTLNMDLAPKVEEVGKLKKYTWQANGIAVKRVEAGGYEAARYLPQIEVAPNTFEYDGYPGTFKTWADFSKWNYKLYEERQPFTENRVAEIKGMLQGVSTQEEKIAVLYQYMQRHMRYVSIQLGIGGFKPFPVKFVDEKRYGDCKALTNYMRHLLQVAGIPSYPALINAGSDKMPADPLFPTDPFNHVILCIPNGKDTTWLECTSNKAETGFLGTFTENKKALLITAEGGQLVNTPRSHYKNNRYYTNHRVAINTNGGAQVEAQVQSSGDAASWLYYISGTDNDRQKELLTKQFGYKVPEVLAMPTIKEGEGGKVQMNLEYGQLYHFKAGKKFFFPLSVGKLHNDEVKTATRQSLFLFDHPFQKRDTTTFQLPAGFVLENVPPAKELKTAHSWYQRTVTYDPSANTVTYISQLELKEHAIPAADYLQVALFFKGVAELESENIILQQQ